MPVSFLSQSQRDNYAKYGVCGAMEQPTDLRINPAFLTASTPRALLHLA